MSGHLHGGPGALPPLLAPLLIAAVLVALYGVAVLRQRPRRWSWWRTASWVAGSALLALAFGPPLAALAHQDLRAHMAQHLLLGMFAPLGLVLAAPGTLTLRALPVPAARRLVGLLGSHPLRWLSHPLSALALNVGGMYLLYLTPLYELSRQSGALHVALHAHFLAAGCLFTWAIAGVDPAPHRAAWPLRLAVLTGSIAAHATLAKLMYASGLPRGVADLAELQAAAQLMYYGGDLAELLLAIALFSHWYRQRGHATAPATPLSS
jgi:putative membrane protein